MEVTGRSLDILADTLRAASDAKPFGQVGRGQTGSLRWRGRLPSAATASCSRSAPQSSRWACEASLDGFREGAVPNQGTEQPTLVERAYSVPGGAALAVEQDAVARPQLAHFLPSTVLDLRL